MRYFRMPFGIARYLGGGDSTQAPPLKPRWDDRYFGVSGSGWIERRQPPLLLCACGGTLDPGRQSGNPCRGGDYCAGPLGTAGTSRHDSGH
jgi:hypothetical protein